MFQQDTLVKQMASLKKIAWRLTGNEPDADDLLQTTVLRALEKRHLFQTGTDLLKLTSKIMYNQFVSSYRRRMKFESQYDPQPYIDQLRMEAPPAPLVTFGPLVLKQAALF